MDANPYALLFDDEPTAQERAQMLVQALRGERQQVQARDAIASVASMGQNPLLQNFARGQLARVGQQEDDVRAREQMLANIGGQRLSRTLQAQQQAQTMGLHRDQLAEQARHNRAEEGATRAPPYVIVMGENGQQFMVDPRNPATPAKPITDAAGNPINRPQKGGGGKPIPAKEVTDLGGIDAANQMLDKLMQTRGQKAHAAGHIIPAGAAQFLPGTDAAQYQDAQKAAAQTVGLILEGGKLAESDLGRYMALMPTAGDSDARAKAKVENIKVLLNTKKTGQLNALKDAGFDTGTLSAGTSGLSSDEADEFRRLDAKYGGRK